MIEALAAAALGCPRIVPEQDLSFVWGLLGAFAAFAAGKLLSDYQHRGWSPPRAPPDP